MLKYERVLRQDEDGATGTSTVIHQKAKGKATIMREVYVFENHHPVKRNIYHLLSIDSKVKSF